MTHAQQLSLSSEVTIDYADEADFAAILRLQQANHADVVRPSQRAERGFVTLRASCELLRELTHQELVMVARVAGEVVGYLFAMDKECAEGIELFKPFTKEFEVLEMNGKPLLQQNLCVIGQVCVAYERTSGGIARKLYTALSPRLSSQFDLAVTEVSSQNKRSLMVHRALGYQNIGHYDAFGETWQVIAANLCLNL